MRFWAAAERAKVCDLLDELGPDAPTLCAGWKTSDLAAHLVVREHSLVGGAGIFVPALAPATRRAMARVVRRPFPVVVGQIRRGGWLPREGRVGESLHLLELVVHRQDMLRASPGLGQSSADGAVDPGFDRAVFEQLRRSAGFLGRKVPAGVGVLLRSYQQGSIEVRRGPTVVIVDGDPVELVLWLFGRVRASNVRVDYHGSHDDDAARVEASLRR